jgi:hypothetical protein
MGAAVALNQATWRSIPEDASPQINTWFQFWGHLAIMTLPVCVVEIYNWELRRNICIYICGCVCCAHARVRERRGRGCKFFRKKPLVGAVSHQTVKGSRFCEVGFLLADWNLQIKKIGSWLGCTLSCHGLLLIPVLSLFLHIMGYVFTKIIMTECTSWQKTLFMLSVVSQMKTIKNYHMIYCRKVWYRFVNSQYIPGSTICIPRS